MANSTKWFITAKPIGDNAESGSTDKNVGGVGVYVSDGLNEHEVSRVAWVRRNAKNSRVPFDKQLKAEMDKAQQAADALNEIEDAKLAAAVDELVPVRQTLQNELTEAQTLLSSVNTLSASELSTALRVAEALKTFDDAAAKRVEDSIPDLKERFTKQLQDARDNLATYDDKVRDKIAEFANGGELL